MPVSPAERTSSSSPELPYTIENVCAAIERRAAQGKHFSILAVAEGAMDAKEAG